MANKQVLSVCLEGQGRTWQLPGPDVSFRIDRVKHVSPLEQALIAHLPRATGRILVPLPHGAVALTAALSAYDPDARVEVFELDAFAGSVGRDKTRALPNVAHVVGADIQATDDEPHCAAFIVQGTRDRLLTLDVLDRLAHVMPDRSPLLVAIAKKRIKDVMPRLERTTTKRSVLDKTREGIVFQGLTCKAKARWTPRIAQFSATTPRAEVKLTTRPGVFSHGRPDMGGTALAESAQARPSDRVLDLGCGAGLVGLLLAEQMRPAGDVTGEVVLVDSNARAIECARRNIETNGLAFVRAELSHEYRGDGRGFQVVVGNPPYYAGRRIARYFIDAAMDVLAPGGAAYFVSKHGRELAEYAAGRGFRVEGRTRRGYDVTVGVKPV